MTNSGSKGATVKHNYNLAGLAAAQLGDITFNKYWAITPPALSQEESVAIAALPDRLQAFLKSDADNSKLTAFVMAHMDVFGFMGKQNLDLAALEKDLAKYRNNSALLKNAIQFEMANGIIIKININLPDNSPIAKLLGTLATQFSGKTLGADQKNQVVDLLDVIGLPTKLERAGWSLKPGASQSEYVAGLLRAILNEKIDDELALKYAANVTDITKDANGNSMVWFGQTQVNLSGKGVSLSDGNSHAATVFAVESLIAINGKEIAFNVTADKNDVPAFKALCKEMIDRGLKLDAATKANYNSIKNNFVTAPVIKAELVNA